MDLRNKSSAQFHIFTDHEPQIHIIHYSPKACNSEYYSPVVIKEEVNLPSEFVVNYNFEDLNHCKKEEPLDILENMEEVQLLLNIKSESNSDDETLDEADLFFTHNTELIEPPQIHPTENLSTFSDPDSLPEHVPPDAPQYRCEVCQVMLPTKPHLMLHTKIMHTEKDMYACPKCSSSYLNESDFTEHLRTHLVYRCNKKCQKLFSTENELLLHEPAHSKDKDLRTHLEYKCKKCQKSFSAKNELLLHQQNHPKDEIFMCRECQVLFYNKSEIIQHLSSHRTEKSEESAESNDLGAYSEIYVKDVYKCGKCQIFFAEKDDMIQHLQIHRVKKCSDLQNVSKKSRLYIISTIEKIIFNKS